MATTFTSVRYPFAIDGAQGEVAEERDYAEHVEQLMKQVLMTAPGERINRPDFGCGVKRLVFAPMGEATSTLAQSVIYQALTKWLENVIQVLEVRVSFDRERARLDIYIAYSIRARGDRRFLNLEIAP
jgi:phage baseplate assembly protein W